jgi:diadenylate cyclase
MPYAELWDEVDLVELFKIGFVKVGLSDLIDIAAVAFIFYKLLMLMKGTRAVQMLTGLFLLFLASFAAYWLQLDALRWLISNVAPVAVIAIVVVFQPELRRALARLGQGPLMRGFLREEESGILDEVVQGALKLSQMKLGGLIVLEQVVGLKSYVETGKIINAAVSADLITTIFTSPSPLHDGALIIRGSIIVATRCTLPLTQNPRYRRVLGMRHQAAVGISEESDAVVVVVSEETGAISVANRGRLHRRLDEKTLLNILVEFFQEGRKQKVA